MLLPLYHFNANIRGFTSTGPSLNHCQGSESQHARVKSRANPRPQERWALPFKSSSRGTNALATKLWCLKVHISVVKSDTDICHSTQPFLGIYPREKKTDVPTKPSPQMLRALLHAMAPNGKQPECPSTGQRDNKSWSTHTMECYSATRRNKLLIHACTQYDTSQNNYSE